MNNLQSYLEMEVGLRLCNSDPSYFCMLELCVILSHYDSKLFMRHMCIHFLCRSYVRLDLKQQKPLKQIKSKLKSYMHSILKYLKLNWNNTVYFTIHLFEIYLRKFKICIYVLQLSLRVTTYVLFRMCILTNLLNTPLISHPEIRCAFC